MAIRKIKDAKDLSSNELIYFKGHAKAIYMSDGSTVEDAINNIEVGTGADLSAYATKEELNSKQDTITDLEVIRHGAEKGATALQSYTEQYKGTVTGVKINGSTKNPSSGVVDLGNVITSHQDISSKQDKLVSGTNIKTINGNSLLGSGDITISGSGNQVQSDWRETDTTSLAYIANKPIENVVMTLEDGTTQSYPTLVGVIALQAPSTEGLSFGRHGIKFYESNLFEWEIHNNGDGTKFLADDGTYKEISSGGDSSNGSGAYSLVNHGTSDTTFTLTPNIFHVWDEVITLDLDFGTETEGVANEYLFLFTSGSTATSLSLPDDIKWINTPNIGTNKIYLISILNGLGTILEFDV